MRIRHFAKIIPITIALICSFFCLNTAESASAMDCKGIKDTKSYEDCIAKQGNYDSSSNCRYFLGMVSWDCNTNFATPGYEHTPESLKTDIWAAVANVITDITIIAAYLVIGYVIYGGYLYMFSGGESGKTASGKKTLSRAFIGLGITMTANIILNTIRIALLGANGSFAKDCTTSIQACADPTDMVTGAISWVVGTAGVVAAIFVVYGGITYITSSGDPNKVKKAKDMILYALIGLAICALAETITAFVGNTIRNAKNDTNNTNGGATASLITPKEDHVITIN